VDWALRSGVETAKKRAVAKAMAFKFAIRDIHFLLNEMEVPLGFEWRHTA